MGLIDCKDEIIFDLYCVISNYKVKGDWVFFNTFNVLWQTIVVICL